MFKNQAQKEQEAQQALTGQLAPGESLLTYTQGNISGLWTAMPYYIGLTNARLLLLRLKHNQPSGEVFSLRRDLIQKVKRTSFLSSSLQIMLPGDTLTMSVRGGWSKRAKELADLTEAPSAASAPTYTTQTLRQQVMDLRGLGLSSSANKILNSTLAAAPALTADPGMQELQTQTSDTLWALRATAGMLLGTLALNILIGLLILAVVRDQAVAFFTPALCISTLIDGGIAISFLRDHAQYRGFAIFRLVAGFIVYGLIMNLAQGAYLEVLINAAINGGMVLALTGQASRLRTWVSIGVYILGLVMFGGSIIINIVLGIAAATGS